MSRWKRSALAYPGISGLIASFQMNMIIQSSISDPTIQGPSWDERWEGPDQGLICAWLRGIEKAKETPELAQRALNGELPVTGFKGGVEKSVKTKDKLGALHYLAQRQGLRGEDLYIDQDAEVQLTCSRTGVIVTFTGDTAKLLASADIDESTLL